MVGGPFAGLRIQRITFIQAIVDLTVGRMVGPPGNFDRSRGKGGNGNIIDSGRFGGKDIPKVHYCHTNSV